MVEALQANRQEEKSQRTRHRVLASTVDLIRQEGLTAASPLRIARHTGVSWGAVQHHFGSKEELLSRIVLASRDQFNQAVSDHADMGLSLAQRISRFVDRAWAHYQSDIFLAAVEITFRHRRSRTAAGADIAGDDGKTSELGRATLETIFAGTGAEIDRLIEANGYMHCVLMGLAFHDILWRGNDHISRHLAYCKHAMADIVGGAAP